MAIDDPDSDEADRLAQPLAALQQMPDGIPAPPSAPPPAPTSAQVLPCISRAVRARGPHPLPHFLDLLARHCAPDRELLGRALAGLARYQALPPAAPRAERPIIASIGNVKLRDYGTSAKGQRVLVVPSLINAPTVLDLAPDNSLLGALAAAALHPLLVDWGDAPEPLGLADLVSQRLLPLLRGLEAPVPVLGYCLGGTLAAGLAAVAGPGKVSRLALLATPWHFTGYGAEARAGLADWWAQTAPLAERLRGVPMDLLQPAFWSLDVPGLVAKYARLASADDAAMSSFAALEDWSNTGPPLSLAAAREMAGFYADDAPGGGRWQIAGAAVDITQLGTPLLDVVAMRDRIVPPAAALSCSGIGHRLEIEAGHVGMIMGSKAPASLWQPLAQWLARR